MATSKKATAPAKSAVAAAKAPARAPAKAAAKPAAKAAPARRLETDNDFGVVAYTKGSRFTDEQVRAAVRAALSQL
jgi:hypothetical protein